VALVGATMTAFEGRWVSNPESTRLAENKPLQLAAAANVGLRLPKTLIGGDPQEIRRFCEDLDFHVVVKTVAGTPLTPI
jgi:glutathione synthase/RimK-type ligase-like ATP-grasp enzyme